MFEIELYAVTKGPRSIETFKQIDTDNDRQLSKAEIELYLQKDFEKDANPRDKSYQPPLPSVLAISPSALTSSGAAGNMRLRSRRPASD